MTATAISTESAPRDLEALTKLGRFNLRNLGEACGAYSSNNGEEKQAFLKLDNEAQAQAIFARLLEIDKAKKGGATAAPSKSVVRTPVTGGKAAGGGKAQAEAAATGGASGESAGGNASAVIAMLTEIRDNQKALSDKYDSLSGEISALQGHIAGTNKIGCVAVSLALQLSEQVLQAPADDVLKAAIDQLESVEATLTQLVGGSADENGSGGDDKGNE